MSGTLASLVIKLGLDASGVEQGVAGISKSFVGLGSRVQSGSRMAGSALADFASAGIDDAIAFDDAMREVYSLLPGISADTIDRLSGDVRSLAVEMGSSTQDLAGGLYQVISAFGDTPDATAQLAIAARSAVAGVASTEDAVTLLSAVTKGYGDTSAAAVQQVADLSFQAVKLGQTTFPELAASMGKAVPLAATLGVRVEELYGGFATLTGVTGNTAEVATQLRGVFQALIDPPTAMAAAIEEAGYASGAAMVEAEGFAGTLALLAEQADGDTQRLAEMFGSVEALNAVLALTGPQADDLATKTAAMGDAAGSVTAAYETMAGGVGGTVRRLGAQLRDLSLTVGGFLEPVAPIVMAFGPQLGSLLSGALRAGVDLAVHHAAPAVARLVSSLGRTAGRAFTAAMSGAIGVADRYFGPLAGRLGDAASSLGRMAGGKFGMAFKAAAAVGIALLLADELRQLGEVRQANLEAAADIESAMGGFLATMPSRAEVEAKLAALRGVPESLDDVQRAVYDFGSLASGNVLGSAVDALFGANPAQVNQEQIAALEAYLARLPAEVAPVAAAAGAQVTASVATGVEQGAGAVRQAGAAVGSEVAQGVRDGIASSASTVASAWDAVASALAKGPKIMSRAARLSQVGKAVDHATRMLRRSIVANDPLAASYWEAELAKVSAAQAEFRGTTTKTMGQVKADLEAAGLGKTPLGTMAKDAKRDAGKLKAGVTAEMDATARRTKRAADRTAAAVPDALDASVTETRTAATSVGSAVEGPLTSLDAFAWGQHAGASYASGLASQAHATEAAAQELAAATHAAIGFSRPPRRGPLASIRSWGPHLVATWTAGIERHVGDVERTASRLAGAIVPAPLAPAGQEAGGGWRSPAAGFGGGRGGEVHLLIGTLIADERGLDELDRRLDLRRRLRGRSRPRANDPA